MKNYIIYFIVLVTGTEACKKELTEEPYLITQENFYNSEREAQARRKIELRL